MTTIVKSEQFGQLLQEIDSISKINLDIFTAPETSSLNNASNSDCDSIENETLSLSRTTTTTACPATTAETKRACVLLTELVELCSPQYVSGLCQLLLNMVCGYPTPVKSCLQQAGTLEALIK